MIIKQFKTGVEAKSYLLCLKMIFDEENRSKFESFETRGVQFGWILNEATRSIDDIYKINWIRLMDYNLDLKKYSSLLDKNNDRLKGGTIKFKLSDKANKVIDNLTVYLSQLLKQRVYRAFAVKLLLKYLLIIKAEENGEMFYEI